MSITFDQATKIAWQSLNAHTDTGTEVTIYDDQVREFDVGWVFYYQLKKFIETGDFSECLVGNAPFFVARSDGAAESVSYHRDIEESIAAYRACGDINAKHIAEVELIGWNRGAQKIEATKCIRELGKIGLTTAKEIVDNCLAGTHQHIATIDIETAKSLSRRLRELGFSANVRYQAQPSRTHSK